MPPPKVANRKSLAEMKKEREANLDLRPSITIITGNPGAGKTTLAATMFSPDIGERITLSAAEITKAPVIELPGAIWIEADEQGVTALDAKRIRPEFVLSLQTLTEDNGGDISKALRELHAYIGEAAEAGATGMVLDTATSFGGQWLEPAFIKPGVEDFGAGYGHIARQYSTLFRTARDLGLRQVWLAQPQENKAEVMAAAKKGTELDKAKALTQSIGGGKNYVVPALSGKKFPPVLNSLCSISAWLRATTRNGRRVRELLPYGGDGSQGKTRYEGILDQIEEADLWKLDEKIQTITGTNT